MQKIPKGTRNAASLVPCRVVCCVCLRLCQEFEDFEVIEFEVCPVHMAFHQMDKDAF